MTFSFADEHFYIIVFQQIDLVKCIQKQFTFYINRFLSQMIKSHLVIKELDKKKSICKINCQLKLSATVDLCKEVDFEKFLNNLQIWFMPFKTGPNFTFYN